MVELDHIKCSSLPILILYLLLGGAGLYDCLRNQLSWT